MTLDMTQLTFIDSFSPGRYRTQTAIIQAGGRHTRPPRRCRLRSMLSPCSRVGGLHDDPGRAIDAGLDC